MDRQIFTTLLDIDFYKFTMSQAALTSHPRAFVQFKFIKRTQGVSLPDVIPERALTEQLNAARRLRFTADELDYLRSLVFRDGARIFSDGYLDFLAHTRLQDILVEPDGDTFRIEVECYWPEVSLWETIVLSVLNELYYSYLLGGGSRADIMRHACVAEGERRLDLKLSRLRGLFSGALIERPVVEFGTRRRASRDWQRRVTERMAGHAASCLAGTSNVALAKELGLTPIGTFAHEMDMCWSRLCGESDADILASHGRMLDDWWSLYGAPLSIALTDTFGTEFFFRDFGERRAREWRGLRHDSGPWRNFGERALQFYRGYGIDSRNKVIVWSDGLDMPTIAEINREFGRRIGCLYGWGTNLTNDLGLKPLSLVVKVTNVDGYPTVKLSDNPAKALGPAEEVARFKRIFGYRDEDYAFEECTY